MGQGQAGLRARNMKESNLVTGTCRRRVRRHCFARTKVRRSRLVHTSYDYRHSHPTLLPIRSARGCLPDALGKCPGANAIRKPRLHARDMCQRGSSRRRSLSTRGHDAALYTLQGGLYYVGSPIRRPVLLADRLLLRLTRTNFVNGSAILEFLADQGGVFIRPCRLSSLQLFSLRSYQCFLTHHSGRHLLLRSTLWSSFSKIHCGNRAVDPGCGLSLWHSARLLIVIVSTAYLLCRSIWSVDPPAQNRRSPTLGAV